MPQSMTDVVARDLMQSEVLTLPADERVSYAVSVLEEGHLSGAPVVDASGKLRGFLSTRDIARSEHLQEGRLASEGRGHAYDTGDWDEDSYPTRDDYNPEVLGDNRVKDWMNPEVISVAPDAGLKEVCRTMSEQSIHRVLVVDEDRLVGIVSTSDIVRFLAETL